LNDQLPVDEIKRIPAGEIGKVRGEIEKLKAK